MLRGNGGTFPSRPDKSGPTRGVQEPGEGASHWRVILQSLAWCAPSGPFSYLYPAPLLAGQGNLTEPRLGLGEYLPKSPSPSPPWQSMNIYTDGSCIDNGAADAVGAWAFVVEGGPEKSGPLRNTTNNRSELQAIIEAVSWANAHDVWPVTILTDSQLCVNCALGRWKRKANLDLWADYEKARAGRSVAFQWVRGHSGVPLNERADELCAMEILRMADDDPQHENDLQMLRDIAKFG